MEKINLLNISDIDQILKISISIWSNEGNYSDYVIKKVINDNQDYGSAKLRKAAEKKTGLERKVADLGNPSSDRRKGYRKVQF